MIKNKIYSELKAPVNKAKLITSWQNTNDIIEALKIQHQLNLPEAKQIAKYFKGDGEIQTAKNIFNFLKNEISYIVEPSEKQTTKTIARFLSDGYGDCKHFSSFTNVIMQANGYKSLYRFSGYKGKSIQHVYTYLPKTNTICDAVLPTFDTEKTPKNKIDIDMSLYQLSGTDNISGLNFTKVATNIKKAQAATSDVVKKAAASIPKAANDIKQGMVTAGLAAPRAAFLALVQLNFTGIASDFKKIIDQKGDEGIKWWVELGGDRSSFTKAIEAGANRKSILNGIDEENASYNEIYKGYSGDGVSVGVVVATTAATATPILVKALEVIKKLKAAGIDPAKLADQVKKASAAFKDVTGKNITDVIFKKEEGKTTEKTTIDASDLSNVDDATAEKVATAAIAQGAGVDAKTITDIAKKEAKSGNSIINQFNALSTTKKIAYGGGALAVIGIIVYSIKKK
jgi:hypothetical protein